MSCTPAEYAALTPEQRAIAPTHVAPSLTRHPRTGDVYSAYNKPGAVIDWLANTEVGEEYVLIIDADMIMRQPFLPRAAGAGPGRAVSAYFAYMKGVANELALKHVPDVTPRDDTEAGPRGRRGDQCGGFTLMKHSDLTRVAPLWLKFTEDVRFDPDAWELTGDAYSTKPGDKPWISEMYGYSYACAKSDVWHTVHRSAMLYPGYEVSEAPAVLHYGLVWDVVGPEKYSFDKHWHYDFDPLKCPPWDLSPGADGAAKGGLFPHAPSPKAFQTQGSLLLRDLLAVETPITLNAAFCERHRKKCPVSAQLDEECGRAERLWAELRERMPGAEAAAAARGCEDKDARCGKWAAAGECEKNAGFMRSSCRVACGLCDEDERRRAAAMAAKPPPGEDAGAADTGDEPWQGEGEEDFEEPDEDKEEIARAAALAAARAAAPPAPTRTATEDEEGSGLRVPEIKLRCTRFPTWGAAQVARCMALAAQGMWYDPVIDDPEAARRAEELHASAHELLARGGAAGRAIGHELAARVHHLGDGRAPGAARLGGAAWAAWATAAVAALACVLRARRRGRRAPGARHGKGGRERAD
jgi:hypothetical protein